MSMQVCFVSTYQEGKPPADATYFFTWLTEAVSDFRVGKEWLKKVCDHSTVVRSYLGVICAPPVVFA